MNMVNVARRFFGYCELPKVSEAASGGRSLSLEAGIDLTFPLTLCVSAVNLGLLATDRWLLATHL